MLLYLGNIESTETKLSLSYETKSLFLPYTFYTGIMFNLNTYKRLRFCGGGGETHSSGQEGLALALQVNRSLELLSFH